MLDSYRLTTLLKLLNDIRSGFNETSVSEGMALIISGRLVSKEDCRL